MAIKLLPKSLWGTLYVPPSKSISHRAIIAAALSEGESVIKNVMLSQDIEATCNGLISLGADIQIGKHTGDRKQVLIRGKDIKKPAYATIYCNESGSTLRFLIPLAAIKGGQITFKGRGRLVERPLDVYYDIFNNQTISYKNNEGKLPLTVHGKLKPDKFYVTGDVSSQFISGLMFALPLLAGDSEIIMKTPLQSRGYVDLTMDVLSSFGIRIENNDYNSFIIKGNQNYKSVIYHIEEDYSQAAFWLAAGVLSGCIKCKGLKPESLQGDKDIIRIIQNMGGKLIIKDNEIMAYKSVTRGMEIDASQIPDLVPVIAVMASLSKGRTVIKNAGRLRIKESDRLRAITIELNKVGANIEEMDDGLIIHGVQNLAGGTVDSWNDHRIAMALAVAATRSQKPIVIKGEDAVNKSYPGFWTDYKKLGGEINERYMG